MSTPTDMFEGPVSLLRELRDRDTDTGLLRPARLYQALLGEIARSERYGNPLGCVLLLVGGLRAAERKARLKMATKLADSMRNTDYAGVWDRDEFLLVLPETDQAGARQFADKVKEELGDLAAWLKTAGRADVSIDIRITTWRTGDDAGAILERLETRTRARA